LAELEQNEGLRPRLFDSGNPSYWPRLIVTDADRTSATRLPSAALPARADAKAGDGARRAHRDRRTAALSLRRPACARRVGGRCSGNRAWSRNSCASRSRAPVWREDFGRVLFQLMVPHDFKDAARQLDRIVLVVDDYTANLPWELMFADDQRWCGGKVGCRWPCVPRWYGSLRPCSSAARCGRGWSARPLSSAIRR
jgi:hypothetical protein